jgi:lipoprotein NlpD
MTRLLACALVVLLVDGCAARRPPVEVLERPQMPPEGTTTGQAPGQPPLPPAPEEKPLPTHTVTRGETLYSIALDAGLDYRQLAAWNNIVNPASVKVGQVLVMAPPPGMSPSAAPAASSAPTGPVATPLIAAPVIEARPTANTDKTKVEPRAQKLPYSDKALAELSVGDAPADTGTPANGSGAATSPIAPAQTPAKPGGTDREDIDWVWPVKGKVIAPFTESSKGIDIAGKKGTPVRAAAAGRVIYADHNLRGYGNLIIIRHNDTWLSAYAHNDKLLVKEQDEVKKGQKIAEMGSSDTDQVKLHFEVRRQGKPVDPQKFLPPM